METAYDQEAKLTEEGKTRVKEIFMTIMQREIMKAYKIPNDVSSRSLCASQTSYPSYEYNFLFGWSNSGFDFLYLYNQCFLFTSNSCYPLFW